MTIRVELGDRHATIWLDRPDKHNPLSAADWVALADAARALSEDDGLRCVVLRGAGGRAFSAGADIAEFEDTRGTPEAARAYNAKAKSCMDALDECRHPVLAAIEGLCVGGGLEVAAHCDLRYANASARLGVPIKRLGLAVDTSEMAALLALVGPSTALEMLFEGRLFGAEEALMKGLVTRVFPDARFEEELAAAIGRIVEGAPLVARIHRKMAKRMIFEAALTQREREEPFALFGSEDYRAGYRAFLSKTPPVFAGR